MTSTNTKFARIALFTLSTLFAVGSQAEETMSHDMSQMPGMNMGQQQQQQMYPLNGRVVTVDTANQQVTLEHDAVTELNWPAMTMPFKMADAKLLDGLQPGQTIMAMFTTKEGEAPTIVSLHTM
ncbi:MAG: copper-binding protein [Tolumonas sp.]|jgi:Cu/Ag efflux protein CusF|uniref:copper-binding protein n=1 Tax=Tolumonas auensis TaxID=43948 RepID=UPI001B5CEBD4|nr:copper-binding protein [Tolumonas auensis]MBP7980798.1 copper-binding protein [Tolumonas sp.]